MELDNFANYISTLCRESLENLALKLHQDASDSARRRRTAWREVRIATQDEREAQDKIKLVDAYLLAWRAHKIVKFEVPEVEPGAVRRRKQA